ncbi:MAG: DEAD/DEAH box helicase, partial [Chloroflexia bacterium]|nr:DEAD/DEAH box helicase [Chloroflexia bacterium]
MPLYAYQERVDALLRAGRNIILQAPTGAGKTRAALFPFLDGWRNDPGAFPRQCIYAVPMRVLANQFEAEYKAIVTRFATSHGLTQVNSVCVQTGARPDDRKLESDLIFTTIDQVLSSFLTIPYSLSNRQANLNAGAIIGSYLVFDEFHLFPVDEHGNGALATTLAMLQLLKGMTPFVLMTATFSETMLRRLCTLLDAEPVVLTQEEIDAIPSQQGKQRRYRSLADELTSNA